MNETLPDRVRLGAFEVDLRTGELRAEGQAIRLQEQPFQILRMLIERDGDIVGREAIQKKLWPNDTVVEFEHSINTAIKKLRQAFGDSADKPVYIGTVARRGYRLLTRVTWLETDTPAELPPVSPAKGDLAEDPIPTLSGALVGKNVSHYRVLEVIGGGGMGMVYKAEDLKLGRRVALKFLPDELAGDPLALKRFEREARTASALEHRNICAIYGVEEYQKQPFIVMQYLEGETLRDRMARVAVNDNALALDEILAIAAQICCGLQAAHAKNIIHRDIKPANIFLTEGGETKILDFGVAKLIEFGDFEVDADIDSQARSRPTIDKTLTALSLTRTGVALGTAGYMSPEQVQGEQLDARTDLFSFGLVLYEMATGRRAFSGETAALLHDAIVNQVTAPVRRLNPALPAKLDLIITKALEKKREVRYQQASEIITDLTKLRQAAATRFRRWAIAVALAFLVATAAGVYWMRQHRPIPLPELKLRQLTHSLNDNPVRTGAISPDGKYLAYTDLKGIHVEVQETGRTQSIAQPVTLGGRQDGWAIVQWFPDGEGFVVNLSASNDHRLSNQHPSVWRFFIHGDAPRKLRDDAVACSISRDGKAIVFLASLREAGGYREIWQMGANGEQATKLLAAEEEAEFIGAQWLVDGIRLGYGKVKDGLVVTASTDFKEGAPVTAFSTPEASLRSGLGLPDGRALYVRSESGVNDYDCNVWTLRIDLRSGELTEKARQITDWNGYCVELESFTADSRQVTFLRWAGEGSISVANLSPGATSISSERRLTPAEGRYRLSAWTPDSQTVIFLSKRNGQWGIYKQALNEETPDPIVLSISGHSIQPDEAGRAVPRITPDGKSVLYARVDHETPSSSRTELMRIPVTRGTPQRVLIGELYGPPDCARAPATLCVVAEQSRDLKQLIFTAFNPERGRGAELARTYIDPKSEYKWAISPDGTRLAIVNRSEGRIQIASLDGKPDEDIVLKEWTSLAEVAWAPHGSGFFVSSLVRDGAVLLHVDMHGKSQVVWKQQGAIGAWGLPSPDGRHLAIDTWTLNSNIWMMENF